MTLNHIHIGVTHVGRSKEFYESFFGFRKKFDHEDGVFLEDSEGFLLAIDPVKEKPKFPSWFHIGFCLNSKQRVKEIYESMRSRGVEFAKPYQEFGDDAAAFYCLDPDGYKIEISWHAE